MHRYIILSCYYLTSGNVKISTPLLPATHRGSTLYQQHTEDLPFTSNTQRKHILPATHRGSTLYQQHTEETHSTSNTQRKHTLPATHRGNTLYQQHTEEAHSTSNTQRKHTLPATHRGSTLYQQHILRGHPFFQQYRGFPFHDKLRSMYIDKGSSFGNEFSQADIPWSIKERNQQIRCDSNQLA